MSFISYGTDDRLSEDGVLQSSRVQIYHVNLIGHGAGATLVAQIIATFRTPKKSALLSCTFNDRYFVQGHDAEMKVYDYRQVLGYLDYRLIECHTFPLGGCPMVRASVNMFCSLLIQKFMERTWGSLMKAFFSFVTGNHLSIFST
jgi:hypothetical protein